MGKFQGTLILLIAILFLGCKQSPKQTPPEKDLAQSTPFLWEAANIYFLLTDRFNNGNPDNDLNFGRSNPTGPLRGFMGGDIAGITQKIKSGYFTDLGINAIWFTPVVEQIHGDTDEGTGNTYGFHGYWTKDWTALDPNFGTYEELQQLVRTAHEHNIRILMDVVLNHTGPVTPEDPVWPDNWVRTSPTCNFQDYTGTTACTLVDNLPDIYTESEAAVTLPQPLLDKWESEGRLESEMEELETFFTRTQYPKAPKYYIIKWLTDYVKELGIDGYRVDTVKHVNEDAWDILRQEAEYAFANWKKEHPNEVLDETPFYMVGEVYNYGISGGRDFDLGDKKVDYFAHGFDALINFELKYDAAQMDYESLFVKYDGMLKDQFKGKSVVNYLSSHDDGHPFDRDRQLPYKTAKALLLTPGASQIYYGDEIARPLSFEGAQGDANLRTPMDWETLETNEEQQAILAYWQKLGQFRNNHPAVGAGEHQKITESPYVFGRRYTHGDYKDQVVIGLDLLKGVKAIAVQGYFPEDSKVRDAFSGEVSVVHNGVVQIDSPHDIVLLEAL